MAVLGGKVALVIGGTRGIGAAISRRFGNRRPGRGTRIMQAGRCVAPCPGKPAPTGWSSYDCDSPLTPTPRGQIIFPIGNVEREAALPIVLPSIAGFRFPIGAAAPEHARAIVTRMGRDAGTAARSMHGGDRARPAPV